MKKGGRFDLSVVLLASLILTSLAIFVYAEIGGLTAVLAPAIGENISATSVPFKINVSVNYTEQLANVTSFNVTYQLSGTTTWTFACGNQTDNSGGVGLTNLSLYSCSWNPTINGSVTLNFSIFENSTKIANFSIPTRVVTVDTLYPEVSLLSSLVNGSNSSTNSINLSFTAFDQFNLSACNVHIWRNLTIGNKPGTTFVGGLNITNQTLYTRASTRFDFLFSNLGDGDYIVRPECNDTLSNLNVTMANITVHIDTTDPQIDLTYFRVTNVSTLTPNAGSWINISTKWNDNGTNISLVRLWINTSATFANQTGGVTGAVLNVSYLLPAVSAGNYKVWASAVDSAGNEGETENITLTVADTQAPNIDFIAPVNGFNTTSTSVSFNFSVSDFDATARCNVSIQNAGTYAVNISEINVSTASGTTQLNTTAGFNSGTYNWTVYCDDAANNLNRSINRTFTVDTRDPGLDLVSFRAANISTMTATAGSGIGILSNWTDNHTNIAFVKLWINSSAYPVKVVETRSGIAAVNASYNLSLNISGNFKLWVSANDTSGNEAESENITITVTDARAPTFVVTSPANNSNLSRTSVTFNFTATDNIAHDMICNISINATVNITNINASSGIPEINVSPSLGNNNYIWNVTCSDYSSNVNTSLTYMFTLDTIPIADGVNISNLNNTVNGGDGNINITWVPHPSAAKYGLFRSATNQTNASLYAGTSNITRIANLSGSNSYVDNTTKQGITYWYTVTYIDHSGNERLDVYGNQTFLNRTPSDTINPKHPSNITVTNASNVATIRWSAVWLKV
ncbi:hypothetical protein J4401_00775 [Candidatus Woesearchaeota archaeon]|nr:hypothetical protein [Candidatus Woesearchaeota archaeon]